MKRGGEWEITPEFGKQYTIPTYMCCHCGNHFNVIKGSGRVRGYCSLCNHVTCGAIACMAHFPFEKKLDLVEKGKIPLSEL